jgi:hypothetical protein
MKRSIAMLNVGVLICMTSNALAAQSSKQEIYPPSARDSTESQTHNVERRDLKMQQFANTQSLLENISQILDQKLIFDAAALFAKMGLQKRVLKYNIGHIRTLSDIDIRNIKISPDLTLASIVYRVTEVPSSNILSYYFEIKVKAGCIKLDDLVRQIGPVVTARNGNSSTSFSTRLKNTTDVSPSELSSSELQGETDLSDCVTKLIITDSK